MIILILGKPGSGKGTQAELLVKKYNLYYFATGDFSRKWAQEDERIRKIVESGGLISEQEMTDHVLEFLEKNRGVLKNMIFEGFPRYVSQYQNLEKWLREKGYEIDYVFLIDVSDEEVIKRLSARRIDRKTGKIYNLITELPGPEVNPNDLVQRDDDNEVAIKNRLKVFREYTQPTIEYAQKIGKLIKINGEQSVEEIQKEIQKVIEK